MPEVVEVAAIGPTRLDDLLAASGTIAFLVVRDDAIVDERYFGGHTAASPSQFFSVTKWGDVFAQGRDGQFLYLNPARNVAVVRLGRSLGDLRTSQWVSLYRALARGAE